MKEKSSMIKTGILQKRVNNLQKKLELLEKENEFLKRENEIYKTTPRKEFEEAMVEIRELKNKYYEKLNELNLIVEKYDSDMDSLLLSVRSGVKGITK